MLADHFRDLVLGKKPTLHAHYFKMKAAESGWTLHTHPSNVKTHWSALIPSVAAESCNCKTLSEDYESFLLLYKQV